MKNVVCAAVVLAVVLAGCTRGPELPILHMGFDPYYGHVAARDMAVFDEEPDKLHETWAVQVTEALRYRIESEEYWNVVGLVTHFAHRADYAVLVEQVNFPDHGGAWFCLLVQEGDRYWFYATPGFPASVARGWGGASALGESAEMILREIEPLEEPRGGVAGGEVRDKAEAAEFVKLFRRSRASSESCLAPHVADQADFFPWFVHVYDGRSGRAAQYATEFPMLNPDVITGKKRLDAIGRSGEPEAVERLGMSQGADAGRIRAEYEKSYKARLILNGLLRLAWKAHTSAGQVRPPVGSP